MTCRRVFHGSAAQHLREPAVHGVSYSSDQKLTSGLGQLREFSRLIPAHNCVKKINHFRYLDEDSTKIISPHNCQTLNFCFSKGERGACCHLR